MRHRWIHVVLFVLIGTATLQAGENPCKRDCTPLLTLTPPTPDNSFGEVVLSGEDFNGDGLADVLVGAPGDSPNSPGHVYGFSGADGLLLFTATGKAPGERFGASLALASDFNRDGIPDFIVGAPDASTTRPLTGAVYVQSGRDGSELAFFPGAFENERLGVAVAGGISLDDDDRPDIVAAAPDWDHHRGHVVIYSGASMNNLADLKGEKPGDEFGRSVALLDADGDRQTPSVAIGAPGDGAGSVSVFAARTWTRVQQWHGTQDNERFGAVVADAGFGDPNSFRDLAITAPGFQDAHGRLGRVVVFEITRPDTVRVLTGQPGEQFGLQVSMAGDMNGDGQTDLLVTAQGGPDGDGAYLYSGFPEAELHWYAGAVRAVGGAAVMASPGIVNNDGFADALLGYAGQVEVVDCCDCTCHGDPHCNGVIADWRDVEWAIEICIHDKPERHDLASRYASTDVDCDGFSSIADLARICDVASGRLTPDQAYCNPCSKKM